MENVSQTAHTGLKVTKQLNPDFFENTFVITSKLSNPPFQFANAFFSPNYTFY